MSSHNWEHSRTPDHQDQLPVRIPYQHLSAIAVIDWHDYNGEPLARFYARHGHPHVVIPTVAEYLVTCRQQESDPEPDEFETFAQILALRMDETGTSRRDLPNSTRYYYRLVAHCDFATQPADPLHWHDPQRGLQVIAQRRTDGDHRSGSGDRTPWLTVRTLTTLSAVLADAADQLRRLAAIQPSSSEEASRTLLKHADLIVQSACFTELARTLGPRR
ncbi:hypothetical protein ABUW04_31935 [Streptacidiphilus sp. N1-10]|uniref:Uncharacterized protein n=1 Tax=Streptacidiphilus jeojiensis TaxID=3229225 RepID=A0ABV6XX92_9ACTN